MTSVSIWTRLGNWLKLSHSNGGDTSDPDGKTHIASGPEGFAPGAEATDASDAAELIPSSAAAEPTGRWYRRDQALHKLQEGYENVLELLTAVRSHLQAHDDQSNRMSESIAKLADSLGELPTLSARQADSLDSIARQMEHQRSHQEQLSTAIEQWPESARRQTEAVESLRGEVREGAQSQSEVAGQVLSISEAVGDLSNRTKEGAQVVQSIGQHIGEGQSRMVEAMREQTRRLSILIWAALAVSVLAAAAAITALVFQMRGGS